MTATKGFRATLPRGLREDQLANIERWAKDNCACHKLMEDDSGRKVLVGLQSKPRTASSFARTLRTVLMRRGIDTTRLQGHWLHGVSTREALLAACGALGDGTPCARTHEEETVAPDRDTRTVRLY